jgi:hypothetical protein
MSYVKDTDVLRGIIPIQKKFLTKNQLFALECREGFLFGRTIRRRICNWKPYNLIDANGTTVDIAASSNQTELRFRDPRNSQNDILYLETGSNSGWAWFFHGAFGVKPQYIYMYPRYPEGDVIPGKFPNVDPIRPGSGDPISALNGLNSPFEQPTDFHETVILPKMRLGCEYYNIDEKRNHQPVINILFSVYWVQWLKKNMHATLISDIAGKKYRGENAAFLTHGWGDQPQDLGPDLQKEWKVEPMSLDEALGLGGR